MTRDTSDRDMNRDPISGTPGSHPVGVGVGGTVGGVAAGALAGTLFGPIGTLVGAAAGAIAGAAAGKGIAERLDPTAETEYWRTTAPTRPYYDSTRDFDRDYASAYRMGVLGREREPSWRWEDTEPLLAERWNEERGDSRLSWDEARPASRDAWERASRTYDAYAWNDEHYAGEFENAPFRSGDDSYDDYRPAYRYGTYARGLYADRAWDDGLADELARDWDRFRGTSRLGWDRARPAVAAAFRLDRTRPH